MSAAEQPFFHLSAFQLARLPAIDFGVGSLERLPAYLARRGGPVLLVTGGGAVRQGAHYPALLRALGAADILYIETQIAGEPSPTLIDALAAEFRVAAITQVVAIGGGSVLDAGKAIAGLLRDHRSVLDYLEGVGPELPYQGPAVPFIAVPTTAGTGSEATKNAVLSVQGANGYKKSFRSDLLLAELAVVDPRLLASCPPELIAANGMDALTQLLESYVSLRANPLSDALALSGLTAVKKGLLEWYRQGAAAQAAQAQMAYAALLSGITLAQVGLGSVHGLASPLGAFFPIPHGVACGTMVAQATRINVRALRQRQPQSPALAKYGQVAELLTGQVFSNPERAEEGLVAYLEMLTTELHMPRLGRYGVTASQVDRIVANSRGSSMKTNPVLLTDAEIGELVQVRL